MYVINEERLLSEKDDKFDSANKFDIDTRWTTFTKSRMARASGDRVDIEFGEYGIGMDKITRCHYFWDQSLVM